MAPSSSPTTTADVAPATHPRKTCLIVGGGIAGLLAAVALRKVNKEVRIVVVEPKDYMEVFWATFRTPFDRQWAEQSLIPLRDVCQRHNLEHIQAIVTRLTTTEATTTKTASSVGEDNDSTSAIIPFDVCLVAVGAGSHWAACGRGRNSDRHPVPSVRADRLAMLADAGKALLPEKVVIVGGGLTGSEVAGDLAYNQQQQNLPVQVTLVQSGPQLCSEMSVKAGGLVKRKLEKLGVRVILNERADVEDSVVKLQASGESIPAGQVIRTVGNIAMVDFMDSSYLDEKGIVLVENTFAVKGSDNKIFSYGDCCNHLPHQGYQVEAHRHLIARNLNAALKQQSGKLKPCHQPPFEGYVCTVGPKDGVAFVRPFGTIIWGLPYVKNKTLFLFSIRQALALPK